MTLGLTTDYFVVHSNELCIIPFQHHVKLVRRHHTVNLIQNCGIFLHSNLNVNLMEMFIREYGSTLYVGLARAVSPTNTNFRLTFLLTRLQEALYEDLAV